MENNKNLVEKSSSEDEEQESKSKLRLSEAILLAVVSSGAYLCAFYYERGYVGYFNIPIQFVNVSLINLLTFGAIVITFLYSSILLFNGLYGLMNLKHPYLAFYVPRFIITFFLLVLVPFFIFGFIEPWYWIISLIMVCFMSALYLVEPLITHRKKGSWMARYDAAHEKEQQQLKPNLFGYIRRRYGIRNSGLILALIFTCSVLLEQAGRGLAMAQKDFLVINTSPAMVVLRIYGDTMICAPFDRNTHEVKKSFSILKVAEDPKLVLNLEAVGPLKSVEKLALENSPLPTTTPDMNANDNKQ